MSVQAFSADGDTATVSASTSTNRAALDGSGSAIRIYNSLADGVFFKTGDATVEAADTDTILAPGSVETFAIPTGHTHIAVLAVSGTGYVYAQRGEGG